MWKRILNPWRRPGAILIGLALLVTVRLYPERVELSASFGKTGPPRVTCELTSLAHVLYKGWTWGPLICDASEEHQRSPWWLALYAVLLPVAVLVGNVLWSSLCSLGRYLIVIGRVTAGSRFRQIAIGLSALSVLAHLAQIDHLRRGGLARLSGPELVLHDAGEFVSVLLLPLTVLNRLMILVLAWVNRHLSDLFWPAPQWTGLQSRGGLFGAYQYNGVAWELFQAAVLLLVWVVLIHLFADALARRRHS
jgi:hypothetical protein